jgi:hypothetical protein
MSITLFSLPKPFVGLFDVIQQNAIQSWTRLVGDTTVVLFGDEPGTAEVATKQGCVHSSDVRRNDLGTPLINDLFTHTSRMAKTRWMAYVNGDIILPPNLPELIDRISAQMDGPFVLACRRWNIDWDTPIDFSQSDWLDRLDANTRGRRELYGVNGMDLFIFPTGFYDEMPPFAIGWPGAKYDNWLVWYARHQRVPVIDISHATMIFHQNHPSGGGADHPEKFREHFDSLKLIGGYGNCYDIRDASHRALADGTVVTIPFQWGLVPLYATRLIQRARDWVIL